MTVVSPPVRTFLPILLVAACVSLPQVAMAQDFLTLVSPTTGNPFSPAPSSQPQNLSGFNIVINAGAGLAGNAAALAAFNRAANQWEAYFADPITITIDADLGSLGAGIIGSTGSVLLQADYNTIRNQLVNDAADELDDSIVGFMPTAGQFTATLAAGSSLTGNLTATKANLKAIGFGGLDGAFGVSDGSITFNSTFSFDYDNSDGVGAGMMDFETVAAHEIGHALGFISSVDDADAGVTGMQPTLLDLFRFQNGSINDPSNSAQFTTAARDLVAGHEAVFDDTSNEWLMSTGLTQGDGRQASHWKDNLGIGIMDPTLSYGEVSPISFADIRAFDLIGYEVVPEPSAILCAALAPLALLRRKRPSRA